MKFDLKLKVVENVPKTENGKVVIGKDGSPVMEHKETNDAIMCHKLSGNGIIFGEFGKDLSDKLYEAFLFNITDGKSACVSTIDFSVFLHKLHDNKGEVIECDESYLPIIESYLEKYYPIMAVEAFKKLTQEQLEKCRVKQEKELAKTK